MHKDFSLCIFLFKKINNKNMKEKIKKIINEYYEITKNYSIRVLASAITYNLILIIFPLMILIDTIINKLWMGLGISSILFIISLIWSTSSLVLTFKQISDIVYYDIDKRGYIKSRFLSFLYCLLIIAFIIILLFLNLFVSLREYYILGFITEFLGIWLITSFIYKKIIPVYVRYYQMLAHSIVITIIWYIMSFLFTKVIRYFLIISYNKLYHEFAGIFVFIYFMYLLSYIFIGGIIYQYYLYKNRIIK